MGNLIVGIIMIIGGLSGTMVMRGTNSPMGLAVFGVILCIAGFTQMGGSKKKKKSRGRTSRIERGGQERGRNRGRGQRRRR